MSIEVYPNGCDGEDKFISVLMNIKRGKFDSELKPDFDGDITVTLLNQLGDENHYPRKISLQSGDPNGHQLFLTLN